MLNFIALSNLVLCTKSNFRITAYLAGIARTFNLALTLSINKSTDTYNMNLCKLFTFIFLCFACNSYAQNLVPNGSFEEVINCPQYLGDIANTVGWYGSIQVPGVPMNENPSPDWYHECALSEGLTPPLVLTGYQQPLTGEGYGGIVAFSNINPDYREYLAIRLDSNLNIGSTYTVDFKFVRGQTQQNSIISNNFGFKFTTYPIFESASLATNNFAHFKIDTMVNDTTNWIHLTIDFIADSTYSYFHIGNFYDDQNTDIEFVGNEIQHVYTYYFIDDVEIYLNQPNGLVETSISTISVYPNPATSDKILITGILEYKNISIYDCLGKFISKIETFGNDSCLLSVQHLKSGLYFIVVENSTRQITKKLIILH